MKIHLLRNWLPKRFQKIESGNPNYLQEILNKSLMQVLQDNTDSEIDIDLAVDKFTDSIPELADEITEILYKSLLDRTERTVKDWGRFRKSFENRHYQLWKKGFVLLEAFIIGSFEAGQNFNNHYRDKAAASQDYVFDVLTRLHARAIHIGWEVLALLKAGYADGAHARWRTAHEIAVVANFIAMHGQETAQRYLEHEVIESYKAIRQYQQHAVQLKVEEATLEEVADIKNRFDELCRLYGPSFQSQYGWASKALTNKSPKFSDLEEAATLNHLRPYYRMASHNVHANPKGVMFRLGVSEEANLLLAGPSNYGLADPAHGIALSVLQATIPMLNHEVNMDAIVIGKVLTKFADDIGEAFLQIHQDMKQREASK